MNAVRHLEAHYLRVPGLPLRKGTYPYPTSYTEDETGQQINFECETRVPEKLVFTAKADSEVIGPSHSEIRKTIFGRDSQAPCSARPSHAPRLRAVTTLPGSWIMVVIDFSPYSSLGDLTLVFSNRSRGNF
jgi:hypothetical protein